MKKSDLIHGTKVLASINSEEWGDHEIIKYVHDEYDDYTLTGVVLDGPAKPGHVVVLWDDNDQDYELEEVDIKLLTLASERGNIEVEFKSYQKQIKEKMREAAKLVHEAGDLAKQAHARSLESMYDACRPLVSAMDDNGWRSSSWGC